VGELFTSQLERIEKLFGVFAGDEIVGADQHDFIEAVVNQVEDRPQNSTD